MCNNRRSIGASRALLRAPQFSHRRKKLSGRLSSVQRLNMGGALTVTQGVMATGATFTSVEQTLNLMVASGYVFTRENPETGLLEYVFTEMI